MTHTICFSNRNNRFFRVNVFLYVWSPCGGQRFATTATKMADEDITANLPTLQFEAALTTQEKELLYLRARSHALTLSSCGQAAFLVAILNGARQKIIEKRSPAKKKSSKLLQEAPKRDPLLVGVIGCGRVGKQLANTLLKYSDVQPEELLISTRRPETLSALQARGVHCGFDNVKVCSTVDLLFIACLPSQFATVAKEIKGHLSCPVYILTGAIPLARIRQILEYDQFIKPEMVSFDTDDDSIAFLTTIKVMEKRGCRPGISQPKVGISKRYSEMAFDFWTLFLLPSYPTYILPTLVDMLSESVYCEMTCPLRYDTNEKCLIETNPQWAQLALYSFINMCTTKELTMSEVVTMCNTVFLGFGPTDDMSESITLQDIEVDTHWYTLHKGEVPELEPE
ncbi:hypothetical protein QZH41_019585 [Actinostola sp. cb2023]|nr:hypothetical protein QZH41_019585 [Actinostola sp. cb2023]